MSALRTDRVRLLAGAVLVLAGAIAARLYQLQVSRAEELRMKADEQSQRRIEVHPTRGPIVDRHGEVLALSVATRDLFAHPSRLADPYRTARQLAPVLGVPRAEIEERLASDRPFVYLGRFLDPDRVRSIEALGLELDGGSFGFLPSFRRDYPRRELAVHVVGFASVDGVGLEGVEKVMDAELRGDPSVYLVVRDGRQGHLSRVELAARREPREVVLTLDVALQRAVERELDQAMRSTGAASASAVLLDVQSAEVLALANRPAADANRFGEFPPSARVNRTVVHQYEPGSTFKLVTMAAALEAEAVRPGQLFDCERGSWMLAGRRIRDTKPHDLLSASQIMQESSNIGMVKIARLLEPERMREMMVSFGFGHETGIELPGERPGLLRPLAEWRGHSVASLAFGQEIGVTVLQMASAFATLANDGVKVAPRIILGTRGADGRLRPVGEQPRPERVVSARTAAMLSDMLEAVITRGTGSQAAVDGFRLAGKSGTAQKIVNGAYSSRDYVASFGGYGPLPSPRLACLVVIDSPSGDLHAGASVAGPAFASIMAAGLRHLRIAPDRDTLRVMDKPAAPRERFANLARPPRTARPAVTPGRMPDARGLALRTALVELATAGCRVSVSGSGLVIEQRPAAGSPLTPDALCELRLTESEPPAEAPAS